jgi:alkane 1-monooxygenase
MILHALPFAVSLLFLPVFLAGAWFGGWWIALIPAYGYIVVSVLDRHMPQLGEGGLDPAIPEARLFWHRLVTLAWVPAQLVMIFAALVLVFRSDHLSAGEAVALALVLGIATGGIGITYAHELIHQRNRWERQAGRLLLISVLYGHFATEHVLVHHTHVGTPKDPVTARYNESFYRFFARVLWGCLVQSWAVERDRLARRGRPVWHRANPFWQYGLGSLGFLAAAFWIGGWWGVGFHLLQSFVAITQLELVNYIEHYGLTRKHLGDGRYEPVRPHHSWNAGHRASNWLLINLQLHSDHHWKPDRRFPLLQNYPEREAPQLPWGYPVMCMVALNPLWFRRLMNPKVRAWRKAWYPEIRDWEPYKRGTLPVRG